MNNTYYTSLSGMQAAAQGLQNTAHNMANMQSPGFKSTDPLFSALKQGVNIAGHTTSFKDGHLCNSDNPYDLALQGEGYFTLQAPDGTYYYTRDGRFAFNEQGILCDKKNQYALQGVNSHQIQGSIINAAPVTHKGEPTHEILLQGDYILPQAPSNLMPEKQAVNAPGDKPSITLTITPVYDTQGNAHTLTLVLQTDMVGGNEQQWSLTAVQCETASITWKAQSLLFDSADGGAACPGYNRLSLILDNSQSVIIDFGTYMDYDNRAVHLYKQDLDHMSTNVEIKQQDGCKMGAFTHSAFNEKGQVINYYDNGMHTEGQSLLLSRFNHPETALIAKEDNLFYTQKGIHPLQGRPNDTGFGSVYSQQLESSNVDATRAFENMIALQRMFQACSQMMDIDKQLIEGLK